MGHWSDCASHDEPAKPCDCGGVNLAGYGPERFRPANIPGRNGMYVDLGGGREGYIDSDSLATAKADAIRSHET